MIIATKMYCDHMETEKNYLDKLSKVTKYNVKKDRILFFDEADAVLMELVEVKKK